MGEILTKPSTTGGKCFAFTAQGIHPDNIQFGIPIEMNKRTITKRMSPAWFQIEKGSKECTSREPKVRRYSGKKGRCRQGSGALLPAKIIRGVA
eukprot:2493753-Pleurochrysis_carterae.AAC.2